MTWRISKVVKFLTRKELNFMVTNKLFKDFCENLMEKLTNGHDLWYKNGEGPVIIKSMQEQYECKLKKHGFEPQDYKISQIEAIQGISNYDDRKLSNEQICSQIDKISDMFDETLSCSQSLKLTTYMTLLRCEYRQRSLDPDYIKIDFYVIKEFAIKKRIFNPYLDKARKHVETIRRFPKVDLIFNQHPSFSIMIFDREGDIRVYNHRGQYYPMQLSYVNYNEKVKAIICEALKYYEAAYPDNLLYKDLLNEITEHEHDGELLTLPNIKLEDVVGVYNKKDLFEKRFKKEAPNSVNKMTFTEMFGLGAAMKYVKEEDRKYLINLAAKSDFAKFSTINYSIYRYEMLSATIKNMAKKYLTFLMLEKLGYLTEKHYKNKMIEIIDYIDAAIGLKEPINIRAGKRKIKEMHDDCTTRYAVTQIIKKYGEMNIPDTPLARLKMPKEFVRLETAEEMITEGKQQHNCVATYIKYVMAGQCIIYKAEIRGERLTIEFRYRDNVFFVAQCFQAFNHECSPETEEIVEEALRTAANDFFENDPMGKKIRKNNRRIA